MRRREAPPVAVALDADAVPDAVRFAGRQSVVMAELNATPGPRAEWDYFAVRRRQRADAEAWCASHGVSAEMVLHGRPEPSAAEAAAGQVRA